MYSESAISYPFCNKKIITSHLLIVFFSYRSNLSTKREESEVFISVAGCIPNETNSQCLECQNGFLCHCSHLKSISVFQSVWKQLLKVFKCRQERLNSFQKLNLHSDVDCFQKTSMCFQMYFLYSRTQMHIDY